MSIPSELQPQLDKLVALRDTYRYAGDGASDKILTCVIAPTAVGKSTIIDEALRLCELQGIDADVVGSITTRARRPGADPDNYRTADEGINYQWMIEQIQSSNLTNWSLFATGDLYGCDIDSFTATYNLLPLQPDSLPMLQRAGFRAVHVVYITAPVDEWALRLTDRRDDPKFVGRIREAIDSLTFATDNLAKLSIVHNTTAMVDGQVRPTAAAQKLIDIMLGGELASQNPIDAADTIDAMLGYARQLGRELAT